MALGEYRLKLFNNIEDLGTKSVRRNPLIADLLHRISFIEKAGTGIRRMRDGARDQGYPEPSFSADGFFTAVFHPVISEISHDAAHDTDYESLSIVEYRLLKECNGNPKNSSTLLHAMGYTIRSGNFKESLRRLLVLNYIEMTIPDKPRSKKQMYRITTIGKNVLEINEEN
jgi:ATP-dependent DNA helicase RecG